MSMEPEDLVRRAQALLDPSVAIGAAASGEVVAAARSLCEQVRACMAARPAARRLLGPLLPRLVAASNAPTAALLEWLDVCGGRLAVGHRPRLSGLDALRRAGASHLVTLLSEAEGAQTIAVAAAGVGLQWIWLPLVSGDPPGPDRLAEVRTVFEAVGAALREGGGIFVHCSAGIHRTGMVTYGLLRFLGLSGEDSAAALARMRRLTADGVGALRLAWGDQFAVAGP